MAIICLMCGEENPEGSSLCSNCGEPLQAEWKKEGPSSLTLKEILHNREILVESGGVIGREGNIAPEFFEKQEHISREHCKIFPQGGFWQIEHISHTNPTVLNGRALERERPRPILNGDRLRIADLLFKVIIEQGPKAQEEKREPKWVITCPVCGKKYFSDSFDFKVEECSGSCAFDEFDKYEIGKISPKEVV